MITELHRWFDKAGPLELSLAGVAAALALTAAALLVWRLGRMLRGKKAADVLTVVAAGMASSVAATGMWHFFSRTMHLPEWIQAILFAFMEISVLASALRARANVARDGNAGADGLAVWVLTSASGLMSASEAGSPQEALVRLGAPLVAAWLWERSMVPERRAQRAAQGAKETAVAWLLSYKRLAVRLGLATALGADLETEDANRRIDRFVRADNRAQRAGFLTRRHAARRRDRAHARLMEQARMQADPRALYSHLGRQAILDVLARLGGDDAVIDRERARQMQGILTDATDTARPAPGTRNGATAANAFAKAFTAAANTAANGTPVTTPAGPAAQNDDASTPPGHRPAGPAFATHEFAPPAATPAAAYEPPYTAPAPRQDELPLSIPAARQPAAAPPPTARPGTRGNGSHRAPIPVEPARFIAPTLPEPEPGPGYAYNTPANPAPETTPPAPPPAPAPNASLNTAPTAIDNELANRITNAIAASPKLPNLLKLANELGISITQMQDHIDALGGFNAVWNRVRQDQTAEHTDDDFAFYSA